MKKILLQILMVVVYVSLSFSNEAVTLEIRKASLLNTAIFNVYQNDDTIPFTVLDVTLSQPWTTSADLVTINGVARVHVVPVNILGQEGSSSPEVSYAGLPDGSDVVIIIEKSEGN